MILGDVCTRNCGYCAVAHGRPVWEDREEPERVGRAVARAGARARGDHVGEPRRPGRRRARHFGGRTARRPARRSGVSRRGADSRFPGQRRGARDGHRGRPGHPQPQHRDGAAALQGRPARRALRADAGAVPARARGSAGACREVRDHAGPGRGADELRGHHARPPRGRRRDPDARAVPAALAMRICRSSSTTIRTSSPSWPGSVALGFSHVESGPLVRSSYHAKRQADAGGNNV